MQTFGTFLSTPCVKLPSESIFNRIYPEKRNNCQRIDKFRGIVIKKEEKPMNENIQKFLEQFLTDEALQAKFSAVKTPDEAYELAKSIQDGFTKEEFLEAVQQLATLDEADITDEDLAAAAGGEGVDPPPAQDPANAPQMPLSAKESAVVSASLTEFTKSAVKLSGVVAKTDVSGKASKFVSNVSGAATKAIKNALP